MPFDVTCSCGKQLRVDDGFAGMKGKCPACGGILEIPTGGAAPPARTTAAPSGVPQFSELPLPAEPGDLDDVEAEVPDFRRPTYKLFDPAHIGLAALFAGPVGPFVMLALNYWRLGRPSEAGLVLAGGAIMTAAVAVLSLALPDSVPGLLLGFPLFLGLWFASKGLQGQTFLEHRNSGGAAVSGWAVTGIAALGMMLFAGLVVGMAILHEVEVRPRGLR